ATHSLRRWHNVSTLNLETPVNVKQLNQRQRLPDGTVRITKSAKFYGCFRDRATGRMIRLPLLSDKAASKKLASKIDDLRDSKESSSVLTAKLAGVIEKMPSTIRSRLAELKIIDADRVASAEPLSKHLAAWEADLRNKGNTERHAKLVVLRVRKAFDACG